MTTVTISGHVWDYHFGHPDKDMTTDPTRFAVMGAGPDSDPSEYRYYVGTIQLQYEVPDSYNPTHSQLEALEKAKAQARQQYLAKVREIEERISKLRAIEYTVEA